MNISSIKQLREKCQTVHSGDPTVALIRSVSIYLTWVGIRLGLTGNQVSVFNIVLSGIVGLCFLSGTPTGYLAGAALLILGMVLDSVDGELARYREQSSLTGLLLDRLNSAFIYPFAFFGLGAGLAQQTQHDWLYIAGFMAAWALMGLRYVRTSVDSTVIDALTSDKARMEDNYEPATTGEFTFGAEIIRKKGGLVWTLVDFFLVREIGVVLAIVGAILLDLLAKEVAPWLSYEGLGPMAVLVVGYAIVGSLAVVGGISVFVRGRVVEKNFEALRRRIR